MTFKRYTRYPNNNVYRTEFRNEIISKVFNLNDLKEYIQNNNLDLLFVDDDGNTLLNIFFQQLVENPDKLSEIEALNTIDYFLKKGVNINIKNKYDEVPLMFAVKLGNNNILKKILGFGNIDMGVKDKMGRTILQLIKISKCDVSKIDNIIFDLDENNFKDYLSDDKPNDDDDDDDDDYYFKDTDNLEGLNDQLKDKLNDKRFESFENLEKLKKFESFENLEKLIVGNERTEDLRKDIINLFEDIILYISENKQDNIYKNDYIGNESATEIIIITRGGIESINRIFNKFIEDLIKEKLKENLKDKLKNNKLINSDIKLLKKKNYSKNN